MAAARSFRVERAERLEVLRSLLRRNEVHEQQALLALLEAEGQRTTQSTLSRDLRDLGARKTERGYELPERPIDGRPVRRTLARQIGRHVVAVHRSGTLVVLRTRPNEGRPVADVLEEARLAEVLGVIAGDDTVFVATSSAAQAGRLARVIQGTS